MSPAWKRDFAGVITSRNLRWGDYPGLSRWASEVTRVLLERRASHATLLVLKMEEGFTTKGYKQPLEVETKARKWLILQNLQKECGPVHTLISASVQFSCSVVSNSLRPHELQHAGPPCPSPTPRAYPNSCPLSRWCHLTISSSVIPFSSCLQSFPTFQLSESDSWPLTPRILR